MRNYLIDPLRQGQEYKQILDVLKGDRTSIYLHGMVNESIPHFIYALGESLNQTIFLILEDDLRAREVFDSCQGLPGSNITYYPNYEIQFHNIRPLESDIEKRRITVLDRLVTGEKLIVITSVGALKKKIATPQFFKKTIVEIDMDQEIHMEDFVKRLLTLQYERVDAVQSMGEFAIRGGIIDVFPIGYDNPIRLELFDTEIDSIRHFSIENQRSIESIEGFRLIPAREFLIHDRDVESILKGLSRDIENTENSVAYGVDKEKLLDKFRGIRESLEDNIILDNPDLILPYIPKKDYGSILDYLDQEALVVMEDIARIYDTAYREEVKYAEDVTYQWEKGEVFTSLEKTIIPFKDNLKKIKSFSTINFTQLKKHTRILQPDHNIRLISVETQRYNRNFSLLLHSLEDFQSQGARVIIMAQSLDRAKSIREMLENHGMASNILEKLDSHIEKGQVVISPYGLSKGFEYKDAGLVIITHNEIYGHGVKNRKKKSKKKPKSKDIISYSDLTIGDYVVHENHGVAVYKGLEQISIGETAKDFLILEYRGTDKLYIPIDQMDLVQKYIGSEARKPKLSRLGSSEWTKSKQRAKKITEEIAEDLVALYAKRAKEEGFAFSKDSPWQREFESSFIYEETQAQLRCVEEIKADMEKPKPMERLLCGDVGYGKTEVALRAAFKAILDGKQVAILVPTTILAQQHFNTALERFKDFPVKVEMVSRFRTGAQQKQIMEDTKKGYIDLLIGTHRILSKDFVFKDLGLLIIDEEQRFGVRHKDKLKELKSNVDVLLLSATPIPRTLQMSLTGIRDMSILDEAPEERYPTTTYVIEYEPQIIRQAIIKEMERGGQVYFVYNRVMDIDKIAAELSDLVPEASIVIGHGQMSDRQLENVMTEFTQGMYDILLSTSIIETGMDIHNVNTMIIYNADYMGLSQLYQLKGRIGRSERTSFAYFCYEKGKNLKEAQEKRLKAIRDFTEFGSGFKIAMRDLELRGAGNMLGESQHGHINQIGYDLYVKFLEKAIRKARGQESHYEDQEVELDLKMDSYIPSSYIPKTQDKVEVYKRIAQIDSPEVLDDMVDELIDRFGDIPQPAMNVIYIALIKSMAQQLGFEKITSQENSLIFSYSDVDLFSLEDLQNITSIFGQAIELSLTGSPSIRLYSKKLLRDAVVFLESLEEGKNR